MVQHSIQRISQFGFLVIITGSLISAGVLLTLLFTLEQIKFEQQVTEDAFVALVEVKYRTERLLTSHDLKKEKLLWITSGQDFEHNQQQLKQTRGEQSEEFNQLWSVVENEMKDILEQLENPLFQASYTMDKSLLRRLGEGLNANEQSRYYISLTKLVNSIDYLKQYQGFLLDELSTLREQHKLDVAARLRRTKYLAIFLPLSILMITLAVAFYTSRLVGRVEFKLVSAQHDLQDSLDKVEEQKESLRYMANHDVLTGLPNRLLLQDRLQHLIEKAKRSQQQAGILFIDLDRFKEVNDSLGHSTGDDLLNVVSQRLQEHIRKEDTIARLGGDEFVVLLETIDSYHEIIPVAQKLVESMQPPIHIDHNTLYITTSIGISVYPHDGTDAEKLIQNADAAMYRAKEEGRNTYRFYTSDMTQKALEHVVLETSLRQGLENNEFLLYYQPKMDMYSSQVIGSEALIRWNHPEKGIIPPGKFLPLAEDTGIIIPIGEMVLRMACNQAVAWRKNGLAPGRIAVNLADTQLQQGNIHQTMKNVLKETGCLPEWLEFEVTEGFIMKRPERSISILEGFRGMGIKLAIDDFGTGHSSLTYLKKLPIHCLKIDQSFVKGLPDDRDDVAITRATISLATEMGLDIVAEGIETKHQHDFLLSEGCSVGQGYLYAKPLPHEEVTSLLPKQTQTMASSIA